VTPGSAVQLSFTCTAGGECLDRTHEYLDRLWAVAPPVRPVDRVAFVTAVAELVGNVVAHGSSSGAGRPAAGGEVAVTLRAGEGLLEAEVVDSGPPPDLPSEPGLPDADATSGRGLHLITNLAELGHTRAGDRNVWSVVRRLSR
jgi:anti-sigma regulatory factor (Ser/Thr protein kinase)